MRSSNGQIIELPKLAVPAGAETVLVPMKRCVSFVQVAEKNFPGSLIFRCDLPYGHAETHRHDERIDWTLHPLDRPSLRLLGRARFFWYRGRCWHGDEIEKLVDGKKIENANFMMREIEVVEHVERSERGERLNGGAAG